LFLSLLLFLFLLVDIPFWFAIYDGGYFIMEVEVVEISIVVDGEEEVEEAAVEGK
jgi:hypothetical protein